MANTYRTIEQGSEKDQALKKKLDLGKEIISKFREIPPELVTIAENAAPPGIAKIIYGLDFAAHWEDSILPFLMDTMYRNQQEIFNIIDKGFEGLPYTFNGNEIIKGSVISPEEIDRQMKHNIFMKLDNILLEIEKEPKRGDEYQIDKYFNPAISPEDREIFWPKMFNYKNNNKFSTGEDQDNYSLINDQYLPQYPELAGVYAMDSSTISDITYLSFKQAQAASELIGSSSKKDLLTSRLGSFPSIGTAIGTAYDIMSFGNTLTDVISGRRDDPGAYLSLANYGAQGLNWAAKSDAVQDVVGSLAGYNDSLTNVSNVTGGALAGWGLYQNIAGLTSGEIDVKDVLGVAANTSQHSTQPMMPCSKRFLQRPALISRSGPDRNPRPPAPGPLRRGAGHGVPGVFARRPGGTLGDADQAENHPPGGHQPLINDGPGTAGSTTHHPAPNPPRAVKFSPVDL